MSPSPPIAMVEDSTDEVIRHQAERCLEEQDHKLVKLSHQFTNMQGFPRKPLGYDARPPFSREIQEKLIPSQFCMPQVDLYDGTIDLLDHMESYKTLTRVQGVADALFCMVWTPEAERNFTPTRLALSQFGSKIIRLPCIL